MHTGIVMEAAYNNAAWCDACGVRQSHSWRHEGECRRHGHRPEYPYVEISWGEQVMRRLTDQEHRTIVDELYAESGGDLVGLWEIIRLVEDLVGEGGEVREQCLMIVTDLLAKGLVAGDSPYAIGGYKAWNEQSPDKVVMRIRSEWMSLGTRPASRTSRGLRAALRAACANKRSRARL